MCAVRWRQILKGLESKIRALLSKVADATARYDQIAGFCDATAGQAVTDPAMLLDLAGEVRRMRCSA